MCEKCEQKEGWLKKIKDVQSKCKQIKSKGE